MWRKSYDLHYFKIFKAYAELHTNLIVQKLSEYNSQGTLLERDDLTNLKLVRSYKGGGLLSLDSKYSQNKYEIKKEQTVAYNPKENGVTERIHRTLFNLVRSFLHTYSMEKRFWTEEKTKAVYVRNRVTTRALPPNTTSFHVWNKPVSNMSGIIVFGTK